MQRRVKVRVNGRGDGGVLVLISADTTDEQFVEAAAKKVFKRDAAAAAAVNPAKARIYLPGGEFEADLETIEHDEEVVIAFNGSPYKQTEAAADGGGAGRSSAQLSTRLNAAGFAST